MAMLAKHRATSTTRSSMGWNHRVGTHQIPPDSISNSGLDQRIGTAAAHAVRNVPVAKPEERVRAVWEGMRGSTFDSAVVVAVCTNGRLVGLAPIERLLAAPADAVMADVMDSDPPVVAPGTHQERAAWLASQRAEPGLAVVDEHGHFQGLIPPHRLAGILLREHDEDLDRLGGFLASTADARTASQETVGRRLWHRMPWLAVGLVGAMASAGLLAGIEDPDGYQPRGAYFILGIVYLADAVGTQTRPWRSAAYPWASGSAASPAARRAHRTARRLPS